MRWRWRRALLAVALVCLFLLVLEENSGGSLFIYFQNRYSTILLRNISVKRQEPKIDIAIVVVNSGRHYHSQYSLARDTVQCYSKLNGYSLYFLDITQMPSLASKCPHKDFMFKRHCVLANFMPTVRHEWIFFLDGDIGIVNPNRLLEEFLPEKKYSMVFYERIMNQEVMAGSYLAKNNEFSRRFLMDWANYEFKTPKSFHGTDNGAIHSVLADLVVPGDVSHRTLCSNYWNNSRDFYTLSIHEVCLQIYLSKFPPPSVKILEKGRLSWVRDGWLTNSVWSPKDFMFHGWQQRRKDRMIFARWHSPILERNFDLAMCSNASVAATQWRYKDTFIQSDIVVDQRISQRIADSYGDFVHTAEEIWKRLGI